MKFLSTLCALAISVSAVAAEAASNGLVQKDGAKCSKKNEGRVAKTQDGMLLVCKSEQWQKP